MKILVVSTVFPYPPDDGDRLPIWHFLRRLAGRAHYTLLALEPPDPAAWLGGKAALGACGVEVRGVKPARRSGVAQAVACLTHGRPWINGAFDPALAAAANDALKAGGWDLVQAESILSAQHLPRSLAVPSLLVARDCLSAGYHGEEARQTGSPAARLRQLRTAWMERTLFGRFDHIVTISPGERDAIARLRPDAAVTVVPNGVDLEQFHADPAREEPLTVLFSGAMGYGPNADAAVHFGRTIWPLIRDRLPGARLWLVGKEPGVEVRRLAKDPTIEVTGRVERVEDWLARAAVVVSPLRRGSGVKNKVLEAAASAKPMVVTSVSLAGIELQPGEEVIVEDRPELMAEAVVRLLGDEPARRRLGAAARDAIGRHMSWPAQAERLWAVYRAMTGNGT